MSREERRHYQRMMRGRTSQPSLPPQLRGRRPPQRPGARSATTAPEAPPGFTTRFWIWTVVLAAGVGLLFLSLAWPQGVQTATYWGVGTALATLAASVGMRLYRRRRPPAT